VSDVRSHLRLIQGLGYGGLIPFFGCAFLAFWFDQSAFWMFAIHSYAALIISFLGAVSWGFALSIKDMSRMQREALFCWGVLPALLGWVCLLLPQAIRVGPLAALFLLTLSIDTYFVKQLSLPKFWLQMRVRLTLTAIVALITAELL
jgi:hypothetical protein